LKNINYKKLSVYYLILILISTELSFGQNPKWFLTGPSGGIINKIIIDPKATNNIITASYFPFTGFLKTSNCGLSREVLNNELPYQQSVIFDYAIDDIFPDTMYALLRPNNIYSLFRSING